MQKDTDLKYGDTGDAVRDHQEHLKNWVSELFRNDRDRELLRDTLELTASAAWILGATEPTIETIRRGTIPVDVQRMIADPDCRTAEEKECADRRLRFEQANGHGEGSGGLH
jgi:hypothetical protein